MQGNFILHPSFYFKQFCLVIRGWIHRYGWNLIKANIKQVKLGKKKKNREKNNSVTLSLYSFLCQGHSENMYMSYILVDIHLTKVFLFFFLGDSSYRSPCRMCVATCCWPSPVCCPSPSVHWCTTSSRTCPSSPMLPTTPTTSLRTGSR